MKKTEQEWMKIASWIADNSKHLKSLYADFKKEEKSKIPFIQFANFMYSQ